MLKVLYSKQFKKDFKRAKKQGRPMNELLLVLKLLEAEEPLAVRYRDHPLTGKYKSFRECHIRPDWLLIYRVDQEVLELTAQRTGSHSELFVE